MARRKLSRPAKGSRSGGSRPVWPWVLLAFALGGVGAWWWRSVNPIPPAPQPPKFEVIEDIFTPPGTVATNTNAVIIVPPARTNPVPVSPGRKTNPPVMIRPVVTNPPPVTPEPLRAASSRSVTNILEAQIALTWHGISSGSIDGVGGGQTALALKAFQRQHSLEESGRLDRDTLAELVLDHAPYTRRTVTDADLARLLPLPATWLGKSEALRLDHENLLELVAEQAHAHPGFIRRLNPGVNWDAVPAGTELTVPNAVYPPARRANLVRVSLAEKWIRAFDGNGKLLCHFPCSIGKIAEKRPVGELHVAVAVKDPNYTFNPEVFPESEEGRRLGRKLVVPPGPNNPVGVAWIGLSRPGYGIHGTPGPEQVGRTESHGCFRLANWNAEYLRQMVRVGTPVWIE